jgi:hypothetical protein
MPRFTPGPLDPSGAPEAPAPADAVALARRLADETARRQQAEARADTATATAEAETARAALVGLRATAVQGIASVQARDRADRMTAIHQGLLALRSDLDGLRAVAEAAIEAGTRPVRPAPRAEERRSSGAAPSPLGPDLARSAQELLARGRLDVADEVIRGLEDAAARLRAQSPPSVDG